jgi:GTPase
MYSVAIVGRPNVGKSTLFNRLLGERHAIIEDTPGVTRDRLYGYSDWNGKRFSLVDTGGFIPGSEDTMERAIREQAMIAVEEADAIIFLTDGRDGVTPFDEDIAQILRRSKTNIVLAVNKCDNTKQEDYAHDFYSLGFGEPIPVSSLNGHNTGDLLDELVKDFVRIEEEETDERLKIALLGRPNVGKSSLTNALLGKDRMIVTDIPGTTRDATDSIVKYHGEEIVLIDTAGLRRRSKIDENIEFYSVLRTTRAIDRCDIAVVLMDATRGIEDQDKKIITLAGEARKGIIVAINKWDLVEDKDSNTADKWKEYFNADMKTYDYIPVTFISALTKQRISKVIDMAKEIKQRRTERISTSKLNNTLLPLFEKTPPPSVRGYDLRINYVTQVGIEPPLFALFCNHPKLVPDSYKRFIERKIRENFEFEGTPISLLFKPKNVPYEDR